MIIKIKAPSENEGWWMYDNARDVFFARVPMVQSYWCDLMGADARKNVYESKGENTSHTTGSFFVCPDGLDRQGFHLTFHHGLDDTFEFFGDTEAYLLNDNGKTIERIN